MARVSADPVDRTRTGARTGHTPDRDLLASAEGEAKGAPFDRGAPTGHEAARTSPSGSPVGSESRPASLSILPVSRSGAEMTGPPDPRRSDVDEWGRSEHMRSIVRRLYDPMYKYWFRVEWEGLEKIPRHGGALLIANHAGAIPSDAPAIMHGVEEELGRPVYGLADYFFRTLPVVGTMWSRTGGVPAHPDNAYRLLHDQQQLALVFPEGTKATSKTYTDRYRLRRFGRGGFVEIAMRAGVPVVPIAVVGAEESMPILFRIPSVAKLLNLPYFPVTANALLMGPLGYVTYFPAKFKLRVLDPVSFDVPPDQDRYSRSRIMDEAEAIRARMQDALHDMLRERRSVWFG
jgi:1-acyl-sn-glycerol-3-phosphate acyltransferase